MISSRENPIVAALDIGTTKICMLVGRKNAQGKIKILGMGRSDSLGVARGEVVNIEQTTKAILAAKAEAEEKSGVTIKSVFVGIAGEHISSLQDRDILNLGKADHMITKEDIKKMINNMHNLAIAPGERIIHVIPQEFTVDHNRNVQPIGMYGSRIEGDFHIITGKIAAARNINTCVERAGLEVLEIILEPLASSASVLKEDELEAGVALVDIGGGTTDLAIFHDHIIRHTAVIPFAGNIITEDIRMGCQLIRSNAEAIKKRFGSALPDEMSEQHVISIPGIAGREQREISMKTLANIIRARMEEIFGQIYFEIKQSGYANSLHGGIVITGGGSQLKHLKQMVDYVTGYTSRIGLPLEFIAGDTPVELRNPMYATSIGLLIKGYEYLSESSLLDKTLENRYTREIMAQQAAEQAVPVETESEELPQNENDADSPEPVRPIKRKWYETFIPKIKDFLIDKDVSGKDFNS
jgi:cell division protein FtsA